MGKPVTYSGTLTWEFWNSWRMGYCVNDMQTTQTVESQRMTSCGSRRSQSHKSITQMNRTKQDDIMSKNGNDE